MQQHRASSALVSRPARIASWTSALVAAAILGQTLFFKFTAAPEAVSLFEQLGAEPLGRIGSGIVELVAVVLLLVPATRIYGGLLALATMAGAIGSHLAVLGIELIGPDGQGDGGSLFAMAVVTTLAAATVVVLHRRELPVVGGGFVSAERAA